MKSIRFALPLIILGASTFAGEVKVTLSGLHICCSTCVAAINTATKSLSGAKVVVDKDGGRVLIVATDTAAAQSAADAIAGAGFQGKSDNKEIVIKEDSGAAEGKVAKLELNAHNCCGKCAHDMDVAIKAVPGVKGTTIKPKIASFTVTGNFDAKAVIKALEDAGFHPASGAKK